MQYLADLFWTRWKKEYLQTLQERKKWRKEETDVKKGDVVILKDENACRADWKIARVIETFPSKDGLVRKVKLLMATTQLDGQGRPLHQRSYLERPIHKLIVLLRSESDSSG